MNVIGYVHVSTDEQAADGISLHAQRARIEAYCVAKDWQLAGIETDAGCTYLISIVDLKDSNNNLYNSYSKKRHRKGKIPSMIYCSTFWTVIASTSVSDY